MFGGLGEGSVWQLMQACQKVCDSFYTMSFEYPCINIRHSGHVNVIEYAGKFDSACVRYTSGDWNACKAKETNLCANTRTTILNR